MRNTGQGGVFFLPTFPAHEPLMKFPLGKL